MFILLFLLPLFIIFIISLFGRYLSHKGIYNIIFIMMIKLLLISIWLNYEVLLDSNPIKINLNINYGLLNFNWYLFFDEITSIMIFMIISITLLVIIYTYDYMINDPHINRFYLYIIIFLFSYDYFNNYSKYYHIIYRMRRCRFIIFFINIILIYKIRN